MVVVSGACVVVVVGIGVLVVTGCLVVVVATLSDPEQPAAITATVQSAAVKARCLMGTPTLASDGVAIVGEAGFADEPTTSVHVQALGSVTLEVRTVLTKEVATPATADSAGEGLRRQP